MNEYRPPLQRLVIAGLETTASPFARGDPLTPGQTALNQAFHEGKLLWGKDAELLSNRMAWPKLRAVVSPDVDDGQLIVAVESVGARVHGEWVHGLAAAPSPLHQRHVVALESAFNQVA